MKPKGAPGIFSSFLLFFVLFLSFACRTPVQRDLSLSSGFRPEEAKSLAVVNLDPQVRFSHFVEAELLKKGYGVKEGTAVSQFIRSQGLLQEGALDLAALAKIGTRFQVQGIVLCSVLEFNRFRDSYRLSIRCVEPMSGNTLWLAEGTQEGRKGQKSGELLKDIVTSSLKNLPGIK